MEKLDKTRVESVHVYLPETQNGTETDSDSPDDAETEEAKTTSPDAPEEQTAEA